MEKEFYNITDIKNITYNKNVFYHLTFRASNRGNLQYSSITDDEIQKILHRVNTKFAYYCGSLETDKSGNPGTRHIHIAGRLIKPWKSGKQGITRYFSAKNVFPNRPADETNTAVTIVPKQTLQEVLYKGMGYAVKQVNENGHYYGNIPSNVVQQLKKYYWYHKLNKVPDPEKQIVQRGMNITQFNFDQKFKQYKDIQPFSAKMVKAREDGYSFSFMDFDHQIKLQTCDNLPHYFNQWCVEFNLEPKDYQWCEYNYCPTVYVPFSNWKVMTPPGIYCKKCKVKHLDPTIENIP